MRDFCGGRPEAKDLFLASAGAVVALISQAPPISISEYFLWTLQSAADRHGLDALRDIFLTDDPDMSGHMV